MMQGIYTHWEGSPCYKDYENTVTYNRCSVETSKSNKVGQNAIWWTHTQKCTMLCVTRLTWEQVLVPSEMNWQSLVPTLWQHQWYCLSGWVRFALHSSPGRNTDKQSHIHPQGHTRTETDKSAHKTTATHTHNQPLEDQEPIQIENLAHTRAPRTGSSFRMSKHFPHEG